MNAGATRTAFWSRLLCLILAVVGLFMVAVFAGATAEGASPAAPSQTIIAAHETFQANRPMVPGPMTLFLLANGVFAGFIVRRMRVSDH